MRGWLTVERLREIWETYRYQCLLVLVIAGLVIGWWLKQPATPAVTNGGDGAFSATSSQEGTTSTVSGKVCVDVKGAVKHPGIYRLAQGARVNEAVAAAGGQQESADMKQVNLAKQLADQQVVYIPAQGEQVPSAMGATTATSAVGRAETGGQDQQIINLNTATKEQLCQITGVGDKKADNILQYRQQHGQFKSVDELREVDGFGDKTVEKVKDQLAV